MSVIDKLHERRTIVTGHPLIHRPDKPGEVLYAKR